jgi:hypothetical protein
MKEMITRAIPINETRKNIYKTLILLYYFLEHELNGGDGEGTGINMLHKCATC